MADVSPASVGERTAAIALKSGPERAAHRILPRLAIAGLAIAVTLPIFFEIYRGAAFATGPRDDYAPQMLALLGITGDPPLRLTGTLDQAPFGYRALSTAVAIPFYFFMPAYESRIFRLRTRATFGPRRPWRWCRTCRSC